MSPTNTAATTSEAPEAPEAVEVAGDGHIDPELLRLIQRVAHREHLLDGAVNTRVAARIRSTADSSSTRRRPATGSVRTHVTRGTTARKVTWS